MADKTTNSRSEQKRDQILKAASMLFTQQGYAVSMSTIAKVADVSKQTVYSHFKTKDELFEKCIEQKCVSNKLQDNLCDDLRPIRQVLTEFAFNFQSMLLDEKAQETVKISISQRKSHPQLSLLFLQFGPKNSVDILARYLQVHIDKKALAIDIPVDEAAMQLLLMFHGQPVYYAYFGEQNQKTDAQRQRYLDNCVDVFLASNSII